jgi:hypothetical protein
MASNHVAPASGEQIIHSPARHGSIVIAREDLTIIHASGFWSERGTPRWRTRRSDANASPRMNKRTGFVTAATHRDSGPTTVTPEVVAVVQAVLDTARSKRLGAFS